MSVKRQELINWLQKLLLVSFNLLFFLTPFIFTWMNQELFEFSKMLFVYLMTAVILTLWVLRMMVAKKIIWQSSKFDYAIWAFVLSQLISTIFSIHSRTSWFGYYTRFNGGFLSTLTYVSLFYAFISNIKKSQIQAILSSLFLSSLLVSLYAIPEHFGFSPSCWLIAQKFDTSCWVQDVQNRVFATFGQPNWLAAFLIAIMPLIADRFLIERKMLSKLYLLGIFTADFAALLFSKSRSGLLALAAGLFVYAIFKLWSSQKERLSNFWKLTALFAVSALIALAFGTPYTPKLGDLIQGKPLINQSKAAEPEIQVGGTPSEEIRKIVWRGALQVWKRYPIFGSGVETFAYSYYLDRPIEHNLVSEWDFLYNKAHNELLNFLANSGLVGLLTYLGLFVMIFYLSIRERAFGFLAGILAMFISNFFGFSTVVSNLLLFGFFAMVVLPEQKKVDSKGIINNKEYYYYSMVLLAGLFMASKIFSVWQADYLFTKGQNTFNSGNYKVGLPLIQAAIQKAPKEAFLYDELASSYSQLSIAFANEGQSTASAQLAQSAIESNLKAIELNPAHLNFYKNQARIYIRLGQIDPKLYSDAKNSLEKAITLAPTDAKLYYNLALVSEIIGDKDQALQKMEYAVAIKSNYLQARGELARMYFQRGELQKAKDQYVYSLEKIAPKDELVKEKLKVVEASLSAQIK